MPSTLTGLIIFVLLLLPGFVFQRRRARDRPAAEETALQEGLTILFSGLLLDGIGLAAVGGMWAVLPGRAVDVSRFVLTPSAYLAAHPARVLGWAAAVLLVAIVTGYLVAGRRVQALVRRAARRATSREPHASAWWLLFEEHPPQFPVHVGCYLTDGAYLSGRLHSYSRVGKESGDRELTLRDKITYREPGEGASTELLRNVGAVSISARSIQFLTVTYLAPPDKQAAEQEKPEVADS
ncbi:DUF6338 family protein [Lentzea sp. NPDC058450]|uniref:DUF6338 family protein n=1 Tax=Lentzea sp. NPDC058450 TaxID=3346505 RepID=UPI003656701F